VSKKIFSIDGNRFTSSGGMAPVDMMLHIISLEDLASYVGLSRRQLQRLFQRYLSCTPSNYYLKIRLQRARQLLRQTSRSIVEVSVSTGFVSSSHFSKAYRETYGHSPSTERRSS
jgi:transcriptional regulator GlxA family with amidase domain